MKRNLYQKILQATVLYQKIWRKTSTNKNGKTWRDISTNKTANNHDKKHGKNQNWRKLRKKRVLSNFISFDSCQLFLVEIFFGCTFWVEMLLQILFHRALFRYIWVECSLQKFFGTGFVTTQTASSNHCLKNMHIRTMAQWRVTKIKCTMQILIRNIGEAFLVFDCVFDVPSKNDV